MFFKSLNLKTKYVSMMVTFILGLSCSSEKSPSKDSALTTQNIDNEIQTELALEQEPLIGLPLVIRATLINPSSTPIVLGKDWKDHFMLSLKKKNSDSTLSLNLKIIETPDLEAIELKEALSLVYEIDTQNLDPLEYDCLLEATGFSSPIKSTSIHFFLKRAETIEERSNILYYRSQHEKDDATALTLLNDLISLNESYLQFSAYASKAYIYAKKTNEDLENKNLDSAQSHITNAVVEMDTFFNKNHLDPKQSNIDNWNDFFTFHYSQYQYLNLLKENIDREKEP
ncbi:MAG: hypothetical protein A2Z91_06800 [Deltaproteobacteria bacterium GWA2_38_16]|nr:MAG: hypothetical protein A2Z91_06800 [Deltaproteobacteria bacterium GWA2_38_16]OGQ03382.1 MAG: hypothetical protein A3D19_04610 [Deltaproteobacteria bacterium RIFCSPHIGHO2_02_FULL_38_15]OGQ33904.1 MAG: hypothetical protein A3A72_03175 [Deltaproteobacteria bacterium RIFCSPLOWO2_01_FULL_38_9]OGQ59554.1 MAG: hypothetical protein A3G92_04610 [Deltaproteobacteria bacterium RIFCSPLOWO2_12_FULL_38_8]HBQ20658.1 hypothetical protein [Deltaproteobacteria bacterium]